MPYLISSHLITSHLISSHLISSQATEEELEGLEESISARRAELTDKHEL